MKIICCDICGRRIEAKDLETPALCLPKFDDNPYGSGTTVRVHNEVCADCRRAIAETVSKISAPPEVHALPSGDTIKWMPTSVSPREDGRYLIADNGKVTPKISVAFYYADNDEWVTNALIHPEDIVCWACIPDIPPSFFPESVEEDDEV